MYLLDTNILSELIKRRPNPHLLSQLRTKPARSLFTSCICLMELRFGSTLRKDAEAFWQRINEEIVSRINIVPFGERESLVAGDVLAELRKTGQSIGLEEVLLAASAISNKFAVVTANTRRFSKIRGLATENWLEEA